MYNYHPTNHCTNRTLSCEMGYYLDVLCVMKRRHLEQLWNTKIRVCASFCIVFKAFLPILDYNEVIVIFNSVVLSETPCKLLYYLSWILYLYLLSIGDADWSPTILFEKIKKPSRHLCTEKHKNTNT